MRNQRGNIEETLQRVNGVNNTYGVTINLVKARHN